MEQLEELMRKKVELERALIAMGAQRVLDRDKPGRFFLAFPSKEYITPEAERVRAELARIEEEIDRLTRATNSDAGQRD